MMLEVFRLIFDSGLFILIWMVQLVVYPSFKYYSQENLAIWHPIYTGKITLIVMPLMLGELGIAIIQSFYYPSLYSIATLGMIVLIWGNTFFQAIPLHQKIEDRIQMKASALKLVQINWIRTVLWSTVFLMTVIDYCLKLSMI